MIDEVRTPRFLDYKIKDDYKYNKITPARPITNAKCKDRQKTCPILWTTVIWPFSFNRSFIQCLMTIIFLFQRYYYTKDRIRQYYSRTAANPIRWSRCKATMNHIKRCPIMPFPRHHFCNNELSVLFLRSRITHFSSDITKKFENFIMRVSFYFALCEGLYCC